jgi:MtrB/PioB family decaheme-associated outer membrane protein
MNQGGNATQRLKFRAPVILMMAGMFGYAGQDVFAQQSCPDDVTVLRDQAGCGNWRVAADSSSDPHATHGAPEPSLDSAVRPAFPLGLARRWFDFRLQNLLLPSSKASDTGVISPDQQTNTYQSSRAPDVTEKNTHPAEDANQPNSKFPPWALYSTRNVDPRIKPNGGLRVPQLEPNFSPVAPDFDTSLQATRNWSLKVSLADFLTSVNPRSSKFNEFRDVRDGAVIGVEAHYRDRDYYLNVLGRNLDRNDEDLNIEGGVIGKYIWTLVDDQTPHNYMFGAKSLYSGIGTGNLTISDSIRADIQNSTSLSAADAKLANYVNQQGQNVDLGLERERRGGDFTILKTYPWAIKIGASNESRDGERPWSGSFGFGDFVEIPWAAGYDTNEFRVNIEWTKPESRLYFIAGFRASVFEDHVKAETFSNPFRVTDSASELGSIDSGPAMGRIALYPNNQYYEPSTSVIVKRLPWDSTLDATFSWGAMRQNEQLLPFSTNTADVLTNTAGMTFNATDPAALPRQSAEASINTQSGQIRWTSKPTDHLRLNLEYRIYRLDNTTPPFVISEFVVEDQIVRTPATRSTFSSVPIGYTRHTATIEGTYDIGNDNRLGLTYTFESWNRKDREVKYTNDNRAKVSFDTKALKWLELMSWYEHTTRTTSQYVFDIWNSLQGEADPNVVLPRLRKFDEAPYNKDDVQLMATIPIGSSMSISGHGLFGRTSYTDQASFGVLNNSHQSYGIDYSYEINDRVSLFVDYGFEKFHTRMRDRTWTPGDPSDPYTQAPGFFSFSNWEGIPENSYHTAGAGVDAYLVPNRLHWTLSYTLSKSSGTQSYSSPVGPSALDNNAFVPATFNDVDNVTYHTINQELEYKFSKDVALAAGYQYESWHINDYNYNGFSYVNQFGAFNFPPFSGIPSTSLYMGGLLPPTYHANVGYFRLKFGL